jgi:hypothetical protein
MTRKNKPESRQEDDYLLIRRVQQCSLILLALLVLISWPLAGQRFACSALLGGVLANSSFLLLKRTVFRLVSQIDTQSQGLTAGFAIKFYLRLLMLALLLTGLSMSSRIHFIGLTAGLSTVMVSIFAVVLGRSLIEFSGNHAKGA